ncbi:MAG: asparagine synthase (glutamine-hydrolyzing) [Cyanobacteriota bacterium]|nr:asparagine synthase (glutamine-hydrolyzing) [Cyanobacteriota bacterium]
MCGLAGLWHPSPTPAPELQARARAMADALTHRGPDDAGVFVEPTAGLALAHRRLAILDLSPAGHQPMASASGRYWIAFNGEIYNHLHLRRQLEAASFLTRPWRGRSDTETLLAAIEAWGLEQTLQRCVGMFALALWDGRERCLHLARDRFGEKPLYWGWIHPASTSSTASGGPVLAFASELSALRALPGPAPIHPEALAAYLALGCLPAPLCIQAGLQQLPPGHRVTLQAGHQGCAPAALPAPVPWWPLEAVASAMAGGFRGEAEALDALEAALLEAVAEQAIADVPLGVFLSGGVDSSLITALLQRTSPQPVRSFTISFPDSGAGTAGFDEAPYARAVAAHLGTAHTEVALTSADAQALIPSLPRLYSEPFADSSQLPTHLVCREARRSGLTVALSGDGGDELFGGYNRHRLAPRLHQRFGRLPAPLRAAFAGSLALLPVSGEGLARDKRQKLVAALRAAGSLEQLHQGLTRLWPNPASLLTAEGAPSPPAVRLPAAPSSAERLMLADALTYLPADILVKVDRAAMAASLETRAPFLDHRVAALAWQLPLAMKIRTTARGPIGKWALRQILHRYVPPALIERPKAGFAIPLGPWLRGPLRPWAEDLLAPSLLRRQGFLRPEPVQRLWSEHLSGRADHTPRLWTVLMWQAWLAEWSPGL